MESYSFNDPGPYLIFGGTGSLGKTLIDRLLKQGKSVVVFSRDEAKHHKLKLKYPSIKCVIGDVRNYNCVLSVINSVMPKYIINAAAMKQVPLCEEYPYEAVLTNTIGTHNIVRAVEEHCRGFYYAPIRVLSISTDKACKPVNSYGMTKALQERIHLKANHSRRHVHNCVRYGNVLESTGSVIPIFKERIEKGQMLQVTHENMTRFLLSLDEAVDLIFKALEDEDGGKIFIPKVKSSLILDVAKSLLKRYGGQGIEVTAIRPGEKMHEILISEEENWRTEDVGSMFVIHDINSTKQLTHIKEEYSSSSKACLMSLDETYQFLDEHGVLE